MTKYLVHILNLLIIEKNKLDEPAVKTSNRKNVSENENVGKGSDLG